MDYSPALLDFVKGWESCSLTPYRDGAGKLTIGWGHLLEPGEPAVNCMQDDADALLVTDLSYTADRVALLCPVALTQQQFDALTDFGFNCGLGNLAMSTLRKRILGGYLDDVPAQILRWNQVQDPATGAYSVSPGLAKRRAAEVAIWTYGQYDRRP